MIPFGVDTVTLVRRVERVIEGKTHVTYSQTILHGCSWRHTERRTRFDETTLNSTAITCRIPASQPRPRPGDYLFLGALRGNSSNYDTAAKLEAALTAHRDEGAFIVVDVKDNARPGTPFPHWAATGE